MRLGLRVSIAAVAVTAVVAAVLIAKDPMIGSALPGPAKFREPQPVGSTGQYIFYANSGRVTQGVRYGFRLFTHCGLESPTGPDFDGSFWRSVGPADDGSGNPPVGFGNPYDNGIMVLVSANLAQYHSSSGATVSFSRASATVTGGLCS